MKSSYFKRNAVLIAAFLVSSVTQAAIRLPKLVSSHMVLQRDKPISIWGWADEGEEVWVCFNQHQYKTTADAKGNWKLKLPKMRAGGPYQMQLQGSEGKKIVLDDILLGDVWLCSGQSNMELPLYLVNNAAEEIKNANYPNIRQYAVDKKVAIVPAADTQGQWVTCSSKTAPFFTAIGYFFARKIQQKLKVPIGLINSTYGGTTIESWISADAMVTEPTFGPLSRNVAQIDTAAYNAEHRRLNTVWIANFQQRDAGMQGSKALWANPALTVSDWQPVSLPIIWEFTGKPDFWNMDGIVWFRKNITLTKAHLQGNATLNLGAIQNADVTYVNGVEVGRIAEAWGKNRSYTVPASLLKEGENTIAVKVENYGGDGGFTDPAKNLYLQTAARQLSIAGEWLYKVGYKQIKNDRPIKEFGPYSAPTLLYNSMVSPLTNYNIKGVLWYQGESNWYRGEQYRELFRRMIADWRQKFNQGTFPFLFVQLAGYQKKSKTPAGSYWAEVREAQDMAMKVPRTSMVTAVDVGDSANIHPKNKQEVGRRLALLAQQQVYGLPVRGLGPHYQSFKLKDNAIIIRVDNVADGLKANGRVGGFQIAGNDQHFYWAQAEIVDKNTIKVFAKEVASPAAVRYAWEDYPVDANVYNSDNLPLFPFRTDSWKSMSAGNTFDK
jgi:sialate O-acetylesterase